MSQTTHQNALPLGSLLMEYRLESVLGAGGFGITYLARDTNLDKNVAIKEYLPASVAVRASQGEVVPTSSVMDHDYRWGLERFIQEARTLAKFGHPHIVRVNRFFEANGTGYMVMDYEDGEPLKAWLKQNPFPPEAALKALLAPLLDGLEKVHAAGFLHRDIKPDNIFVRRDGGPVLIDFGSARQAVGGATQALTTIVSPGYAPFEQYTTTAEQGPWTDMYSLGGVLYFAVSGQNPPDAITRMKADSLTQGLGAARMRYSGPFIDAIGWALANEDAARPRTVAQWRESLFGQRSPAQAAASAAAGSQATMKAPPLARGTPAGSMPERSQRAPAMTSARTVPPRIAAARPAQTLDDGLPSRWKWPAIVVVAALVVGAGVRSLTSSQSSHVPPRASATATGDPTMAASAPPAQETSHPVAAATQADALTGASEPARATPAEAPAAVAPAPVQLGAPAPATMPALPATPATLQQAIAASPAATTPASTEARPDPRLPASGEGQLGFTRDELAKSLPHLAGKFDSLDANHDGHVTPNELVDGMQQTR